MGVEVQSNPPAQPEGLKREAPADGFEVRGGMFQGIHSRTSPVRNTSQVANCGQQRRNHREQNTPDTAHHINKIPIKIPSQGVAWKHPRHGTSRVRFPPSSTVASGVQAIPLKHCGHKWLYWACARGWYRRGVVIAMEAAFHQIIPEQMSSWLVCSLPRDSGFLCAINAYCVIPK